MTETVTDRRAALTDQVTELLTARARTDPMAALLLGALQEQHPDGPDPLDELERKLQALLRANARLREALVAANAASTWVAATVGCCPDCWGLAGECARCHGSGAPGWDVPDRDALLAWVGPALRRSGLTVTPHPPTYRPGPHETRPGFEQIHDQHYDRSST